MYNPYLGKREISNTVKYDLDSLKQSLDKDFEFNILTRSNKRKYVDARRVFVNILYDRYDLGINNLPGSIKLLTTTLLAKYMGYDTHASVLNLRRNFEIYLKFNQELRYIFIKYSSNKYSDEYKIQWNTLILKKKALEEQLAEIDKSIKQLENGEINSKKEKLSPWDKG